MALTDRHLDVFVAAAEALLPSVDGPNAALTSSPTELGFRERFAEVFDLLPPPAPRDLLQLLGLLDNRMGALALYQRPQRLGDLDEATRAQALRTMASSPVSTVRQGFKALKLLAGYLFTTSADPSRPWPVWEAMGYPGPDGPAPPVPKPLAPLAVDRPTALTCDVVVVGSGAGGGVAAAVLAEAGLDVVIIEKGGYRNEADFTHVESEAYRDLYLDRNLGATADGGINMLAGSTLGGGTVINYTTSFPTPDSVRAEWDDTSGFASVFSGVEYAESSAAVEARLGVNNDHNEPSRREEILEKGLRNLGWHVDAMPRNVVDCAPDECGFCGLGCRRAAKQSALTTWIQDAADRGSRIAVNADVERVLTTRGRATGVEAMVGEHPLTVRARAVVLAAGALNTPAVLLRSGLGSRAVGKNLRLHPVTAVWGRFDEPVDPWTGTMQALYSDQFADLDGEGYGFKFETAAVHPLFPALFFPWGDGHTFKHDLLALRSWSPVGVLLRDKGAGRVKVGRDGRPRWIYDLADEDAAHFRTGVAKAAELLVAAGAVEVMASTLTPARWRPAEGGSLEQFQATVDSVGYGMNRTNYLSFHQMGSAAMGSTPANSVVDADNQVHGVPGLYVLDASCFPTSSGVNPMISIQTIAHRGARRLAASLT